ncbi:MAG: oxidoreductase [Aestuariivita sp.]|nr:oxidoreductase [Aestuariivita sp.]
MQKNEISNTGLHVTPICVGTSSLGHKSGSYDYEVSERREIETVLEVFKGPINFMDTSNNYGFGNSEKRIGTAISEFGGLPDKFVLATKVDRDMETGRFDAERVRESLDESLEKLGLNSIDLLHFHDPEHARDLSEITCDGGALDELFKVKEEGLVKAVGLAMGRLDIMFPLLKDYRFDALISHNRYTLLNRSANSMFNYAYENGISILNAAPFAGGVLAKGTDKMPMITYQEATEEMLLPVRKIQELCSDWGVDTGAIALQFSVNDPRITSTLVGVSQIDTLNKTLSWLKTELPDGLDGFLKDIPFDVTDPEKNRFDKAG